MCALNVRKISDSFADLLRFQTQQLETFYNNESAFRVLKQKWDAEIAALVEFLASNRQLVTSRPESCDKSAQCSSDSPALTVPSSCHQSTQTDSLQDSNQSQRQIYLKDVAIDCQTDLFPELSRIPDSGMSQERATTSIREKTEPIFMPSKTSTAKKRQHQFYEGRIFQEGESQDTANTKRMDYSKAHQYFGAGSKNNVFEEKRNLLLSSDNGSRMKRNSGGRLKHRLQTRSKNNARDLSESSRSETSTDNSSSQFSRCCCNKSPNIVNSSSSSLCIDEKEYWAVSKVTHRTTATGEDVTNFAIMRVDNVKPCPVSDKPVAGEIVMTAPLSHQCIARDVPGRGDWRFWEFISSALK
ncbi:uncharacterized protein LOC135938345 [Cloeon dipterum]|uniref:uncharacterized protein LOC135938345 n=1 Tax=Cloeon dipterum TaxID=197152 RepID=UPI00322011FE